MHVSGSTGGTFVITADTIKSEADQIDRLYQIRGADGAVLTEQGNGLSLRAIIGSTGIVADQVTFSEASRPDGERSILRMGDFAAAGTAPFVDGLVPVVKVNGGNDSIQYIRPQRDSSDVNLPDYFQTASKGALDIYVHTSGKPLSPSLTATPANQKDTNHAVTFTAVVESVPGLTYHWYFGDGEHSDTTVASISHQYTKSSTEGQDSYRAYVEVTGDDSSAGRSNVQTILIGAPVTPRGTTPGTGSDDDENAPSHGPNTSKGHVTETSPSKAAEHPKAAGQEGATSPAAPGQSAGARDIPEPAAVTAAPPTVSGVVIEGPGVSSSAADAQSLTDRARTTAPAASRAPRHPRSLAAVACLTLILLSGIGAARESQWVRINLRRLWNT